MTDTTDTADLGATSGQDRGGRGNGDEASKLAIARRHWKQIEIWKPPTDDIRGYMWLEILDHEGIDPPNIIKANHDWTVCCHVFLYGDIWKCVCGELCCEVCFEPCPPKDGQPRSYDLADLAGEPLCQDFEGCEHYVPGHPGQEGYVHTWFCTRVPAGKLPAGPDGRPMTYEWTATLSFKNPCGQYEAIAGFDAGRLAIHQG